MVRERQKGKSQEQAAASANVRSRKTLAKYERLGRLPSELKQRRTYRTRPDASHLESLGTSLLSIMPLFAVLGLRLKFQTQP